MGFTLIEKTEISTEVIEYLREMEKHGGTISCRNYDHDYLNYPKDEKIKTGRELCWKLGLIYKSDSGCEGCAMTYSITSRGKSVLEQALANFC